MKKSQSLRTKIFVLMSLLVALQSIALVTALISSRVFFALDAEAFRLFESTIESRTQNFNNRVEVLMTNTLGEVERFNQAAIDAAIQHRASLHYTHLDEDFFGELNNMAADTLFALLKNNNITGAYVVFNDTKGMENLNLHPALYIRNAAPDLASENTSQYFMEIGPISLSQKHRMALSSNWDTAMFVDNGSAGSFYYKPIEAATQYPDSQQALYGYWATPSSLLKDGNKVVTYSLPLLDKRGKPFGVIGVEISFSHFTQRYLPNVDIPYQTGFYALAGSHGETIDLSWFIPSGPLAQVYLKKGEILPLKEVSGTELWETKLGGLGGMYCSIQNTHLYSKHSPFYGSGWKLIGFVSKETLHTTSREVQSILLGSILLTTALAFVAIFVLTYLSTRKIASLSKYVKGISPYQEIHFKPTYLREIDELTAEVEKLNKSVMNSVKTTGKIMELTSMPLGCFEQTPDNPYVAVTDYITDLLGLPRGSLISQKEWNDYFDCITAEPSEEYANVFYYHHPNTKLNLWLRISEAYMDTRRVGTVMDVTEDIEANLRLSKELDHDALTKLDNRIAFNRKVRTMLKNQPDKIGAMIFIDLDNLKYVNDTYGHDVGDQYLIRAGQMFGLFRSYDGIVSRISGDEFAIYLHGYESKEGLLQLVSHLLYENRNTAITLPIGKEQQVRYSGGIAWYPEDSDHVAELLKLSDFAMYEAKHQRKGTLVQFDRESYLKNAYLLENRETINKLIDEEMVRFAFQPIVELSTGEVYGYEALMRPTHEGFFSPLEVLRVATAQFKLNQLECMVMRKVMRYIYQNREEFGKKKVFVNSIPNQQLSADDLAYIQREYSAIFPNIVIEFIENENIIPDVVRSKVANLRQYGFSIAIDDFGAGFSNEFQVLSLNPDIIKIDMEIIQGIDTDANKQHFLENILSFSRGRGIKVVAEGVETEPELAYLRKQKVDFVQGYLLGRPEFELKKDMADLARLFQAEV